MLDDDPILPLSDERVFELREDLFNFIQLMVG